MSAGTTGRAFYRLAALAALVGALLSLVFVPLVHRHASRDTPSYTIAAKAILHGSYSVPLDGVNSWASGVVDITDLPLPPSARHALERYTYRTPGYPLFLAAFGGGSGGVSLAFVIGAQAVLLALTIFLLALALRRAWGERVALLGAWLYALDPFSKRYVSLVLTEILACALVAAAAYCFVRGWQSRSVAWWAGCGAACGAATLVRPVFAFTILAAALVPLVLRQAWRLRARQALACVACGAVLVAPWVAWNAAVTGSPALGGFGTGWALLVAAHGEGPRHSWEEVRNMPAYRRDYTSMYRYARPASFATDPEAHPRYLVAADRQLRSRAWSVFGERLHREPLIVTEEYVYRAVYLWTAHKDWYQPSSRLALLPLQLFDWTLLALAVVGAALALGRGGPGRALVVLLVLYTLGSALIHVEARYTYPLRGIYVTLAAFAALTAADAVRRRRTS